jgi:integrase
VLLGAHAGLRVAEMVALKWQDVDLAAQQLRVLRGKGGKPRTVWISAGLARALEGLRPYARNDRVLAYGSPERARARMRRLAFRALVKYRGIHALRHTCGTRMAREEGLEAAQHHLGHANLATTQVYAKWNQTHLRDAVNTWE